MKFCYFYKNNCKNVKKNNIKPWLATCRQKAKEKSNKKEKSAHYVLLLYVDIHTHIHILTCPWNLPYTANLPRLHLYIFNTLSTLQEKKKRNPSECYITVARLTPIKSWIQLIKETQYITVSWDKRPIIQILSD